MQLLPEGAASEDFVENATLFEDLAAAMDAVAEPNAASGATITDTKILSLCLLLRREIQQSGLREAADVGKGLNKKEQDRQRKRRYRRLLDMLASISELDKDLRASIAHPGDSGSTSADTDLKGNIVERACSGWWFWVFWGIACVLFIGGSILSFFLGAAEDKGFDRYFGFPLPEDAPDGVSTEWWQARTLVAGLMLGLTFGFLDNFGLFFGSETLDGYFYPMGFKFAAYCLASGSFDAENRGKEACQNAVLRAVSGKLGTNDVRNQKFAKMVSDRVAGGVLETWLLQKEELEDVKLNASALLQIGFDAQQRVLIDKAIDVHEFANSMMGGFGNTFSDVIGVIIGSAVLEIAKSGMRVDPSFWVLDVVSMFIGCLAGVAVPSILSKYDEVYYTQRGVLLCACFVLFMLVTTVVASGVPEDAASVLVCATLGLAIVAAVVLLVVPLSYGEQYADDVRTAFAATGDSKPDSEREKLKTMTRRVPQTTANTTNAHDFVL